MKSYILDYMPNTRTSSLRVPDRRIVEKEGGVISSPVHKKILIILYYYYPYVSGLSLLAKAQAEGLASRGYDVTVLTTRYDASLPNAESVNGVHVVRAEVLARVNKGLLSLDFLVKIIKLSKDADFINPHLPMAHFGLVLPFIDTQKLITQYHCDLNLGPGLLSRLIERFSYWSMGKTLKKSSQVVVTTKDYFDHSRFAGHRLNVVEVHPPIDQARFRNQDATALKIKFGIDGSPKLIGFVGRIVAEKGLQYLLGAIPHMEKRMDDFLILIAGDYANVAGGSVKGQIDRLVENHPDRVQFVGHLKFDELVRFYSLIDVLVLPSVDPMEAFGMVQLEAVFCGTPLVASDMPGVREVIRKTGYGRLVKPRDALDLADKVCELLACPVKVDTQSLGDFTIARALDKYEEIFA